MATLGLDRRHTALLSFLPACDSSLVYGSFAC
jgi:hypothetical protein